jgi:hypothetical protein
MLIGYQIKFYVDKYNENIGAKDVSLNQFEFSVFPPTHYFIKIPSK